MEKHWIHSRGLCVFCDANVCTLAAHAGCTEPATRLLPSRRRTDLAPTTNVISVNYVVLRTHDDIFRAEDTLLAHRRQLGAERRVEV